MLFCKTTERIEEATPSRHRRKKKRGAGPPKKTRSRKRRGATAMEYCVVASFIFAALVVAIQHVGQVLNGSMTNSANKVPAGNTSGK